jgi:hypothetical protein
MFNFMMVPCVVVKALVESPTAWMNKEPLMMHKANAPRKGGTAHPQDQQTHLPGLCDWAWTTSRYSGTVVATDCRQ